MTISYVQAFPPKWIIINNQGTTAGGAQLFTYDSLTRLPKATFQDPGGTIPYPNPIIFDLNGTKGPIYWQLDSSNPTDLYYIEVYDKAGNLLWNIDNFPASGSGGGSNVTTYLSLQNYIANNQFINQISDQAGPLPTNLVLCPSNHKGFTPALINPTVGTYGVLGPDIRFVKNNTTATDSITFEDFALASSPLTGDVTPTKYIRYISNAASGETYKCFQFPITQKVKNLSNQNMTFGIWAAVTSSPVAITIYSRQYYGSGTAATAESVSTRVLQQTINLTTSWTFYSFNFTMPSVSGNSLGASGFQTDDDALYMQVQMPLGSACDVLFTKPQLYLGTVNPLLTFDDYDTIDSVDQTPRCGDVRVSLTSSAPPGWLPMNDGTIGNTGSGATLATGQFTYQLYKTLWDGVSNTYAPVSTGRGASATADFLAGKTLQLPLSLGRALSGAGAGAGLTPRVLGQNTGFESTAIALTGANMAAHTHTYGLVTVGASVAFAGGAATNVVTTNTGTGQTLGSANLTDPGAPFTVPTLSPLSAMNIFIKL